MDLIAAIASGDHAPTHIMYKCNLSWTIMKKQVDKLVEKGYLKEANEQKGTRVRERYFVTEKGLQLLQLYRSVEDIRTSSSYSF